MINAARKRIFYIKPDNTKPNSTKQDDTKTDSSRKDTLSVIKRPIQFFALIAFIFESLVLVFARNAKPEDTKFYIVLMTSILLVAMLGVLVIELKKIRSNQLLIPRIGESEPAEKQNKYDAFLATPMAAYSNNQEYQQARNKMLEIMKTLKTSCGLKTIFFAGENIEAIEGWEDESLSVKQDMESLKDSRYFILVYPEKIVSSVLYEAGMALAFGKPSFYFGKHDNFPFLMKDANNAFNHVKIFETSTYDEVITKLKTNQKDLFENKN